MRKVVLFLVVMSVLPLTAYSQTVPDWYDNDLRRMSYPDGAYFVGFAESNRRSGESLDAATKRLKDAARAEAASTIRVHVKNTTVNKSLSQRLSTMESTFRQSAREFTSTTTTSVDMQIPGLQVETWQDPSTGTIAAFAYVKKATLIRQLEKSITIGLTKIETSLDQVDQLVANGQKMQARDLAAKTLPQFAEVDDAQKTLAAVDENADEETLQLQETRALQNRLTGLIAQLKNGINVFLSCHAYIFGTNYTTLKSEIQGELSKMGCTFVNSAAQSDWAIYITATAREHNKMDYGETSTYFVYIDAKISIDKTATGQRIYENQLPQGQDTKGKDTHDYNGAARDGYRSVAPILCAIIKQQITQ